MMRILFFSIFLMPVMVKAQNLQPWMSLDILSGWSLGYKGQGVIVTVVDTFNSSSLTGNMNGAIQTQSHGYWTAEEINLIAPLTKENLVSFNAISPLQLSVKGLNVVNLSFAVYAKTGYTVNQISWSRQQRSIMSAASNGSAVVVKAAGNDYGTAVGKGNASGQTDYLDLALIGAKSVIFVGALNGNGSPATPISMASYSNVAGNNVVVQKQFISVGVKGDLTGLYGTSFAAPVIAGYSAILGSKFANASSTAIANQLLTTARKDTIVGYNPAIHGRGEASLSRALAPLSIR